MAPPALPRRRAAAMALVRLGELNGGGALEAKGGGHGVGGGSG